MRRPATIRPWRCAAISRSLSLDTFDSLGSILQGHPDMHKTPGVDMSSGSLGQGLSCGIGIQLAAARDPAMSGVRTFVLMGDGEFQEGQIWEAALYAGARKVRGLVGIIDMNGVQLASTTADAVPLEPIVDKWRAFGWTEHRRRRPRHVAAGRGAGEARAHSADGTGDGRRADGQGQGSVLHGRPLRMARQGAERQGIRAGDRGGRA